MNFVIILEKNVFFKDSIRQYISIVHIIVDIHLLELIKIEV